MVKKEPMQADSRSIWCSLRAEVMSRDPDNGGMPVNTFVGSTPQDSALRKFPTSSISLTQRVFGLLL